MLAGGNCPPDRHQSSSHSRSTGEIGRSPFPSLRSVATVNRAELKIMFIRLTAQPNEAMVESTTWLFAGTDSTDNFYCEQSLLKLT